MSCMVGKFGCCSFRKVSLKCSRCRASVEHVNHDVKIFAILGTIYRGRVFTTHGFLILKSVVKVVIHSVALKNKVSSLSRSRCVEIIASNCQLNPPRTFANVERCELYLDRDQILLRANLIRQGLDPNTAPSHEVRGSPCITQLGLINFFAHRHQIISILDTTSTIFRSTISCGPGTLTAGGIELR